MIIKVCGIKHQENLLCLTELSIDMVGFNFYKGSKRYLDSSKEFSLQSLSDNTIKSVGVFVNCPIEKLSSIQKIFNLDYLQLHGDEDLDYINEAKAFGKIIKVYRIGEDFDFSQLTEIADIDYFLFDTYTKAFGGSGERFDWKLLNQYSGATPFLLAGGIGPHDIENIKEINHPQFLGVDINSRFEIEPGLKNVQMVSEFANNLKSI